MKTFVVGSKIMPPAPDGVRIQADESGYTLMYIMRCPTSAEKRDFKSGSAYQFKAVMVDGVLFFLSRIGMQPWCDAPFHRGLSRAFKLERPADGMGTALHLMLVDGATGVLVSQRLIGLSHKFSCDLLDLISVQEPDVPASWDLRIAAIYSRYSTDALVDLAQMSND